MSIAPLRSAIAESGWESSAWIKIAVFFTLWLGLWLPLAVPLAWRWKWYPSRPLTPSQKLGLVGSLYSLFPPLIWGTVVLGNKTFSDYGWMWQSETLKFLIAGWGMGVLGLTLLYSLQVAAGWISWELKGSAPNLVRNLSLAIVVSLWIAGTEEFLFRGFLQTQLQTEMSVGTAAAIASAIFAVLHLIWEVRETLFQLPGLWLMGMVLTLARETAQGSLSLAWGLHAGWVAGIIFLDSSQAITPTGRVRPWLTGLGGHPLAGLLGLLLLLATGGVLKGYR